MKRFFATLIIAVFAYAGAHAATVTKGLIGAQDINSWDGRTETFSRPSSTGGTVTLNKVGTEVDALIIYGGGSSYTLSTINAALTAIGTTNKVTLLLRPGTWTITDDLTIPSNVTLRAPPGALLSVATTKTLTINGPFYAGDYQVFSGAGTVAWGSKVPRVNAAWWGLNSDGTKDDRPALQAAATSCVDTDITLYLPEWANCAIASQLSLRYVRRLDIRGKIVVDFTGSAGVIVGDSSSHAHSTELYIFSVRNAGETVPSDPLIQVTGLKNGRLTIGLCEYVQIYAGTSATLDRSTAYNTFNFDYVSKLELTSADASGWINQNVFNLDRTTTLTVGGAGYQHNNNIFRSGTFESSTITFNYGHSNLVETGRFEGTCAITFDAGTHSNVVTQLYVSSYTSTIFKQVSPTITDNGYGNVYYRTQLAGRDQRLFLNINKNTRIYTNASEIDGMEAVINPGLEKLIAASNAAILWSSDLIPVANGQMFRVVSDVACMRYRVYVYDSAKAAITTEPKGEIAITGGNWQSAGYYNVGADVASIPVAIRQLSSLAYIKIVAYTGVAGTSTPFDYIYGYSFPRKGEYDGKEVSWMVEKKRQVALDAAPTKGFARVGEMVTKTDGTAIYICSFALDTTVGEAVSASETADITVADLTGVQAGDIVGLLLDDGTTYWDTVADVTGGDLTLTGAGPASAAASGNRIVFNRWATLAP